MAAETEFGHRGTLLQAEGPNNSLRGLLTLAAIYALIYSGAAPLQVFVTPHLRDNLGFGEVSSAMVLACVYFSFWAARLFGGRLVPAIGVRRSVAAGILGFILFPVAVGTLRTPAPMWLMAALWGVSASIFWTSTSALLLHYSPRERYGWWSGATRIALELGTVAGLAIQVHLAGGGITASPDAFGRQAAFSAAVAAAALLLSLTLTDARADFPRPRLAEMLRLAVSPRIRTVSFLILSAGFGYGIVLNTINRAVRAQGGAPGYLETVLLFYIAAGLSSLVGGFISDRLGRGRCFAGAFALGAAGLAAAALGRSMLSLAAGSAALGVVFGLVPTLTTAWVGDRSRAEERPLMIGAVFSWRDLGIASALIARGLAARLPDPAATTMAAFAAWFLGCAIMAAVRSGAIDATRKDQPSSSARS